MSCIVVFIVPLVLLVNDLILFIWVGAVARSPVGLEHFSVADCYVVALADDCG
jgi:hypothetical protein